MYCVVSLVGGAGALVGEAAGAVSPKGEAQAVWQIPSQARSPWWYPRAEEGAFFENLVKELSVAALYSEACMLGNFQAAGLQAGERSRLSIQGPRSEESGVKRSRGVVVKALLNAQGDAVPAGQGHAPSHAPSSDAERTPAGGVWREKPSPGGSSSESGKTHAPPSCRRTSCHMCGAGKHK